MVRVGRLARHRSDLDIFDDALHADCSSTGNADCADQ
jgi:hypothetical protein